MSFPVPRKFKGMFSDGITTPNSYLILRKWAGRGGQSYTAAIQPRVQRVSDYEVFVGGKLRIAWSDLKGDNDITPLAEKFDYIGWTKIGGPRLSTIYGTIFNVGVYDGEAFFKGSPGTSVINTIEKLLHTKFEDKLNAINAFNGALKLQAANAFQELENLVKQIETLEKQLVNLKNINDGLKLSTEFEEAGEPAVAPGSNVHKLADYQKK